MLLPAFRVSRLPAWFRAGLPRAGRTFSKATARGVKAKGPDGRIPQPWQAGASPMHHAAPRPGLAPSPARSSPGGLFYLAAEPWRNQVPAGNPVRAAPALGPTGAPRTPAREPLIA